MLGGSTYTAAEMEKRINKAKGGIGKLKQTERKAGPSAPNPSRKYFRNKTHGGGPDSGNIGKMKDMLSKFKKMPKVPKKPSPEDIQRLREKMPKKYPPKREMQPLRKGGSAKGPNRPRPTGPHMWVRGDKRKKYSSGSAVSKSGGITHKKTTGIAPSKKSQKKYYEKQRDAVREMNMSGRGKQLRDRTFTDKKTGRLVPDTKRNRERYGKDRVYKSKASGGRIKYASGGVVMAGKKVGCQIK